MRAQEQGNRVQGCHALVTAITEVLDENTCITLGITEDCSKEKEKRKYFSHPFSIWLGQTNLILNIDTRPICQARTTFPILQDGSDKSLKIPPLENSKFSLLQKKINYALRSEEIKTINIPFVYVRDTRGSSEEQHL